MKYDNGYTVKYYVDKIKNGKVTITVISDEDGELFKGKMREGQSMTLRFPGYYISEDRMDNLLNLEESIKFISEEE